MFTKYLQKYIFIYFIILLCSYNNLKAQETPLKGEINWLANIKSNRTGKPDLMNFENAVYIDNYTHLPYYFKRIQLSKDKLIEYKLQISHAEYEAFPEDQLPADLDLKKIGDSIVINYIIRKESKVPFLEYFFVPLRKNPQNGKIERLKYFELLQDTISAKDINIVENAAGFPKTSVLSTGNWYKFLVNQTGIYKMTYDDIKNIGISDPANVRIFGNGGSMLPEIFSGKVPNDPQEIPVMMVSASNGTFSPGDYILFYAQGPTVWIDTIPNTYQYEKNLYNDTITYFITSSTGGKRILPASIPSAPPNIDVNAYDGYGYHEADLVNLIKSGRQWYGETFGVQNSYAFTFNFPNLIQNEPVQIKSNVAARSDYSTSFNYFANNNSLGSAFVSGVDVSDPDGTYAGTATYTGSFLTSNNQVNITLTYNNFGDNTAIGWLQNIQLIVRQSLSKSSGPLMFRDYRTVGGGNVAGFSISNAPSGLLVWNVDNINNPKQMQGTYSNNVYTFTASADSLHEYIAFDPQNDFYTPIYLSGSNAIIQNQDIHSLQNIQYVVVTHPDFLAQADSLADFHAQKDHLSTAVVTTDQVYNEFSSGNTDPAAIRNFVKMLYDKSSQLPQFLLLFGDGSYDNKTKVFANGTLNNNFIVTYQSKNSTDQEGGSYVSDDYFGLLDDGETITTGLLDIGVGRLPVTSVNEANNVLNKIKYYYSYKNFGDWRNYICFIADDWIDQPFEPDADSYALTVTSKYPNMNINKIYVDAYPQVSTSSGLRAPAVNSAILSQMNSGSLIMNYTGHGGQLGISNYSILDDADVQSWNNSYYPLFITATCQMSRFDDYSQVSIGELIMLNPTGGGIALYSTTRVTNGGENRTLNSQFFNSAFTGNPSYRLGDMFRITKNNTGISTNKLNYVLLGDPALSLAVPEYNIVTDSINHKVAGVADTLKAYGKITVSGRITDANGSTLSGYNGTLYPAIFDKPDTIVAIDDFQSDGYDNDTVSFQLQQSILYKGKISVKKGAFTFSCIMPRDLNYKYGFGKISYYASDSTTDASGNFQQVVIGGLSTNEDTADTVGPAIRLFMNDTTFRDGGITDQTPTLLALVADKYGINNGENGIGHDIIALLDNNQSNSYILDNYYETDLNSYTAGTVTFKFPQLTLGLHQLEFTIWDNLNNSSQASLNFKVVSGENMVLPKVFNYPNPMSSYTNFVYEENFDGTEQDVTIVIYNTAGKIVRELNTEIIPAGYSSGPMFWDGLDGNGNKINSGIYFYHIIVRSNGQTAISGTQKLIVIN